MDTEHQQSCKHPGEKSDRFAAPDPAAALTSSATDGMAASGAGTDHVPTPSSRSPLLVGKSVSAAMPMPFNPTASPSFASHLGCRNTCAAARQLEAANVACINMKQQNDILMQQLQNSVGEIRGNNVAIAALRSDLDAERKERMRVTTLYNDLNARITALFIEKVSEKVEGEDCTGHEAINTVIADARAIAGSVAVQREAQKLAASNAGSGAADANDSSQVASAGSVAVQHGAQTKTDSEAESGAADAKDSSQVPNAGSVAVQHPMAGSFGSLSAPQSSDAPRITKTDKNYPSSKHPNVPGKARPPFKVGMQPTPSSCPPRKKDSDLVVDPHLVVSPDAADKVVNARRLVRPPAKRIADEVAAVDAHKLAKKKVHDDKPLPPWRLLPWHRD